MEPILMSQRATLIAGKAIALFAYSPSNSKCIDSRQLATLAPPVKW